MIEEDICRLFHSNLKIEEVVKLASCRHSRLTSLWKNAFGEEAFRERKLKNYRNSKLGDKNPMKGKNGKLHHLWQDKKRISDRKGYVRIKAPEWFTGARNGGYVDEHVIKYCEIVGITEIPKTHCVHHLDLDKQNNKPSNLICLSRADHTKLHSWITRTIVQRLSRKGVG